MMSTLKIKKATGKTYRFFEAKTLISNLQSLITLIKPSPHALWQPDNAQRR